jgi:hypothetical protein
LLDRFRSHLTYANVAATLALVIAVVGGTAYAANTVFSTDIVNGEVKSVDIGTGQVQSVDVKNEGLSGSDIAESTLQNVNAGTVGGLQMRKINFQVPFGTGPTTVLDLAGLQITAECQNFGDFLDVKAFTSKDRASVFFFAGFTDDADDTDTVHDINSASIRHGNFDIGDQLQIDNATPFFGNGAIGTLNYSAPDGSVVVAHLALDELHPGVGCALTGIATGG